MAFQFDLESDFDQVYVDRHGTKIIDFALGYDLDENIVVLMSVMLVSGESYLKNEFAGIYDLQFGIRQRSLSGVEHLTPPDFGNQSSLKYIPRSKRADILKILKVALACLLLDTQVRFVTMETYYGHLPAKAMRKYAAICEVIAKCGYSQIDTFRDPETGIDYWLFGRQH